MTYLRSSVIHSFENSALHSYSRRVSMLGKPTRIICTSCGCLRYLPLHDILFPFWLAQCDNEDSKSVRRQQVRPWFFLVPLRSKEGWVTTEAPVLHQLRAEVVPVPVLLVGLGEGRLLLTAAASNRNWHVFGRLFHHRSAMRASKIHIPLTGIRSRPIQSISSGANWTQLWEKGPRFLRAVNARAASTWEGHSIHAAPCSTLFNLGLFDFFFFPCLAFGSPPCSFFPDKQIPSTAPDFQDPPPPLFLPLLPSLSVAIYTRQLNPRYALDSHGLLPPSFIRQPKPQYGADDPLPPICFSAYFPIPSSDASLTTEPPVLKLQTSMMSFEAHTTDRRFPSTLQPHAPHLYSTAKTPVRSSFPWPSSPTDTRQLNLKYLQSPWLSLTQVAVARSKVILRGWINLLMNYFLNGSGVNLSILQMVLERLHFCIFNVFRFECECALIIFTWFCKRQIFFCEREIFLIRIALFISRGFCKSSWAKAPMLKFSSWGS